MGMGRGRKNDSRKEGVFPILLTFNRTGERFFAENKTFFLGGKRETRKEGEKNRSFLKKVTKECGADGQKKPQKGCRKRLRNTTTPWESLNIAIFSMQERRKSAPYSAIKRCPDLKELDLP